MILKQFAARRNIYVHYHDIYSSTKLLDQHLQSQILHEKVQVGKDQEKAQSEKDSHSKNRGGKKPN